MSSDDSLPTLKILLIGPSGAGKSACKLIVPDGEDMALMPQTVLTRYCDDAFEPELATATIGIDFKVGS